MKINILNFKKMKGLIPTIVMDDKKQVLMLAYSSKGSLRRTLEKRKAIYYSRSRKKLWMKGEISGNYQEIMDIKYDCDKDCLLFIVKQKGVACHTGRYSCFGGEDFCLKKLYSIIQDRFENPKKSSYTSKILENEENIMEKIKEESKEVVDYEDRGNLIWEIADLTYFILTLMVKKGISMEEIKKELERRNST